MIDFEFSNSGIGINTKVTVSTKVIILWYY